MAGKQIYLSNEEINMIYKLIDHLDFGDYYNDPSNGADVEIVILEKLREKILRHKTV